MGCSQGGLRSSNLEISGMSPALGCSAVPECRHDTGRRQHLPRGRAASVGGHPCGVVCDFADGAEITAAEMASWGPERTVRATLLRRLLTAEDAEYAEDGVQLRGAAVEAVLILHGSNVMKLDLQQCRIKCLDAAGATF